MIINSEPYLIEYNVRMGDPECQVILPRLKTDLVKIFNATINNKLNKIKINWKKLKCMTIVLCSKGYPGKIKKDRLFIVLSPIFSFRIKYLNFDLGIPFYYIINILLCEHLCNYRHLRMFYFPSFISF